MSKLYDKYLNFKKQNPDQIYLFKSGIFYIALEDDALELSEQFNFKLTNLNDKVIKCGFPCSSINKYSHLFSLFNLNVKIIENSTNFDLNNYAENEILSDIIHSIKNIDINNLSVKDSYKFIENLKQKVKNIDTKLK